LLGTLLLFVVGMAVTAFRYGPSQMNRYGATIGQRWSWLLDTIKGTLHTSVYVPLIDTHDFRDDLTNELAGTGGYTVGGITLASKTLTYSAGTNTIQMKAADLTWTALTASAAFRFGVLQVVLGGATSLDPLVSYTDFGADQQPGGIDFVWKGDPTDGFCRDVV
jgi:hypothetical protein